MTRSPLWAGGTILVLLTGCAPDAPSSSPRVPTVDLDVTLAPDRRNIAVRGTVKLPGGDSALESVRFRLSPRFDRPSVMVLEPAGLADGARLEEEAAGRWRLDFSGGREPGRSITLRVAYEGGDRPGDRFYPGPEVSFVSGESPHAWYPRFGPDARVTGRVRFRVPSGFSVTATGSGTRAPPGEGGDFRFVVRRPSTLSFVAGPYRDVRSEAEPPVSLRLLRDRPEARGRLRRLRRILEVLEEEFGPYPHGEFTLVEIPAAAAGGIASGYSQEGYVVLASPAVDAWNLALLAHEMAHQWWADFLAPRGRRGAQLLTEGMAQYGALQVVRSLEGTALAERFRRRGYPGYEFFQNAVGYLTLSRAGHDVPLLDMPPGPLAHELADSKGFLVLDLLARRVGRDRFRAALRRVAEEHAWGRIGWEDLEEAVEAESRGEIDGFREDWLERPGAPRWSHDWTRTGDTVRVEISQASPTYRLHIPIRVEGRGSADSALRTVETARSTVQAEIPVDFPAQSVVLDPRYTIPHWTAEYEEEARSLEPFVRAQVAMWRGRASEAAEIVEAALDSVPSPDPYASGFMLRLQKGLIGLARGDPGSAAAELDRALALERRRDELVPLVAFLRGWIAGQAGDGPALRRAVAAAVRADSLLTTPTGWGRAAEALLAEGQQDVREADSPAGPGDIAHAIIAADNAGNLDAAMDLYASDAELWPPGEPPVRGKDRTEARYREIFASTRLELTTRVSRVRRGNGWALVEGEVRGTASPRDGSRPRRVDDKYLMVLERSGGGAWKIKRLMWSGNGR